MAARDGDSRLADSLLLSGREMLLSGSADHRRIAAWLGEERAPPELEDVRVVAESPAEMVIVLAALGSRYPDRRRTYFAEGRRMNYNPAFPGLVLERVFAGR